MDARYSVGAMQSCHTNSWYVAQFSARRRASLAYFGGRAHDTIDCIDSVTGYESIRSKRTRLTFDLRGTLDGWGSYWLPTQHCPSNHPAREGKDRGERKREREKRMIWSQPQTPVHVLRRERESENWKGCRWSTVEVAIWLQGREHPHVSVWNRDSSIFPAITWLKVWVNSKLWWDLHVCIAWQTPLHVQIQESRGGGFFSVRLMTGHHDQCLCIRINTCASACG